MEDISLNHWSRGGNAITNFELGLEPVYALAIQEYGDPDLYIGPPMPPGSSNMKALRYRNSTRGLDEFWQIFRRIKKAFELIQAT